MKDEYTLTKDKIDNLLGCLDELCPEAYFLEGVQQRLSYLNIDVYTEEEIKNAVEELYREAGIPFGKTERNWLKGNNISRYPQYRYKLYNFCMAMKMNLEETAEFFLKRFLTIPFNYKDYVDAVYFYCIANHKSYEQVQFFLLYIKEKTSRKMEADTVMIGRQLLEIDNDDEFMEFVANYCFDENIEYVTGRNKIRELVESNIELSREEIKMSSGDTYDSEISPGTLLTHICGYSSERNYRNNEKSISDTDLPKLVTESWPKNIELSKILSDKKITSEVIRKALIIMGFYNFFCEKQIQKYEDWQEDLDSSGTATEIKQDLSDFYNDMNALLAECGFIQMYIRHPFDWFILYCADSEYPLDTLRDLLENQFEK